MYDLYNLVKQHELQREVLDEIETAMFCLQDGVEKTCKDIKDAVTYNLDYINDRVEHTMEDVSEERILGRVDAFKQVLQMLHDNLLEEIDKNR